MSDRKFRTGAFWTEPTASRTADDRRECSGGNPRSGLQKRSQARFARSGAERTAARLLAAPTGRAVCAHTRVRGEDLVHAGGLLPILLSAATSPLVVAHVELAHMLRSGWKMTRKRFGSGRSCPESGGKKI